MHILYEAFHSLLMITTRIFSGGKVVVGKTPGSAHMTVVQLCVQGRSQETGLSAKILISTLIGRSAETLISTVLSALHLSKERCIAVFSFQIWHQD